MEKRLHAKKTSDLTYRHYLFHFKWPLAALIFILSFLTLTQINLTSVFIQNMLNEQQIESFDINMIYPINKSNNSFSASINLYFSKKDEIKMLQDVDAANKKQKVVLPLRNRTQHESDSYLILEFTNVFGQPRFCSHTNEQIFGKACPYTNW